MENEYDPEEYKKDIEHLSQVFHEDDPKTFKQHLAGFWEEVKTMGKVWAVTGLTVAGLAGGFGLYIEAGKRVFTQNLIPALKNEILAETVYAYNPSKKNKESYLRQKQQLENLLEQRKHLSKENMQVISLLTPTVGVCSKT